MPKVMAKSPTLCAVEGQHFHSLVYGGKVTRDGRLQRSQEYRCEVCGEYISKVALQEATNNA